MKSRRIGYARLNRGSNPAITDTELQLMRFKIPSTPLNLSSTLLPLSPSLDPVNVSLQTVNSKTIISLPPSPQRLSHTSLRVPRRQIPLSHRFPSSFYYSGVKGHFFHVLTEDIDGKEDMGPWYYAEIEEVARIKQEEEKGFEECVQQ